MAIPTQDDKVLAETLRFEAALPRLLEEHPGKWVVFRDGRVDSVHDTEDEAYEAALDKFGRHGGQIVAQVEPKEPRPVSARWAFGVA